MSNPENNNDELPTITTTEPGNQPGSKESSSAIAGTDSSSSADLSTMIGSHPEFIRVKNREGIDCFVTKSTLEYASNITNDDDDDDDDNNNGAENNGNTTDTENTEEREGRGEGGFAEGIGMPREGTEGFGMCGTQNLFDGQSSYESGIPFTDSLITNQLSTGNSGAFDPFFNYPMNINTGQQQMSFNGGQQSLPPPPPPQQQQQQQGMYTNQVPSPTYEMELMNQQRLIAQHIQPSQQMYMNQQQQMYPSQQAPSPTYSMNANLMNSASLMGQPSPTIQSIPPPPSMSPSLLSSYTQQGPLSINNNPASPTMPGSPTTMAAAAGKKRLNRQDQKARPSKKARVSEDPDGIDDCGDGSTCTCRIETFKGIESLGERKCAAELNGIWNKIKGIRELLDGLKTTNLGPQTANLQGIIQDIAQLRGRACQIETEAILHPLELDAIDVICTACDVAIAECDAIQRTTFERRLAARAVIVEQPYHRLLKQNTKQANSQLQFIVRIVSVGEASITKINGLDFAVSSNKPLVRAVQQKQDCPFGIPGTINTCCKKHNCYLLSCPAESGTRKLPVSISFNMNVQVRANIGGTEVANNVAVETQMSNKYVVFTNECQFDEGNTELFRSICFDGESNVLTWQSLANIIQRHYVMSVRRTLTTVPRYISAFELEYLHATFLGNMPSFTEDSIKGFWEWYVKALHQLRHGKGIPDLWAAGAIWGFISRKNIEEVLKGKESGTFALRFSERNQGIFAACYVKEDGSISNKLFADKVVTQTNSLADVVHEKTILKSVVKAKYNDLDNDNGPNKPAIFIVPKSEVFDKYRTKQKSHVVRNGYESDD